MKIIFFGPYNFFLNFLKGGVERRVRVGAAFGKKKFRGHLFVIFIEHHRRLDGFFFFFMTNYIDD